MATAATVVTIEVAHCSTITATSAHNTAVL